MIEFFIELTEDNISFRLQSDKTSWRQISTRELTTNDFLTSDIYEIIQLQEINSKIDIDGRQWKLNPTTWSLRETLEV